MSFDLRIHCLLAAYRDGALSPTAVIEEVVRRCDACDACDDPAIWIRRSSRAELQPYLDRLEGQSPQDLPLYGIPFAIKDNIDLAGVPTTAACPAFAYRPERSAFVVERLIAAGAIPIGKTNLDQFATGLVGTRSPYGAVRNSIDPDYISGGSSSGSAVAVARGLVSFSLGTDTAGSGRVPAAFNNLVGIKPSRGLISTRGVVPACRTLDCVSIFTLDLADAQAVMDVAVAFDAADAFARERRPMGSAREAFRFGVPRELEFFGDADGAWLFGEAADQFERLGGTRVVLDFEPFLAAARLLYEGPWVAERLAAIERFVGEHADALHPVTREIIAPAGALRAVDAFKAQYRLAELKRLADAELAGLDFVLTPTAGTIYRIDEVASDPIRLNARLGHYTNFMNLLDYAAVAVPAGFGSGGLPHGVTLFAPAFTDRALMQFAHRFHAALELPLGAGRTNSGSGPAPAWPVQAEPTARLVVCGAHLSGLPLDHQLTDRAGRLLRPDRTAPRYGLYALPGGPPFRPGLIRRNAGGASIEVEVWELPERALGNFLAGIPHPLGLGRVELLDGSWELGFICEGYAAEEARDISALGSWRAFLATRR